jgi:hypothetical protein
VRGKLASQLPGDLTGASWEARTKRRGCGAVKVGRVGGGGCITRGSGNPPGELKGRDRRDVTGQTQGASSLPRGQAGSFAGSGGDQVLHRGRRAHCRSHLMGATGFRGIFSCKRVDAASPDRATHGVTEWRIRGRRQSSGIVQRSCDAPPVRRPYRGDPARGLGTTSDGAPARPLCARTNTPIRVCWLTGCCGGPRRESGAGAARRVAGRANGSKNEAPAQDTKREIGTNRSQGLGNLGRFLFRFFARHSSQGHLHPPESGGRNFDKASRQQTPEWG